MSAGEYSVRGILWFCSIQKWHHSRLDLHTGEDNLSCRSKAGGSMVETFVTLVV